MRISDAASLSSGGTATCRRGKRRGTLRARGRQPDGIWSFHRCSRHEERLAEGIAEHRHVRRVSAPWS